MIDKSLAIKAKQIKKYEALEAKYKQKINELKKELVIELQSAGVKTAEVGGVKLTLVAPVHVVYPEDKIKKVVSPTVFKRLHKRVFDPALLEEQVLAGNIDPKILSECATQISREPYIRISIPKG